MERIRRDSASVIRHRLRGFSLLRHREAGTAMPIWVRPVAGQVFDVADATTTEDPQPVPVTPMLLQNSNAMFPFSDST
jgi:hypothetical protein